MKPRHALFQGLGLLALSFGTVAAQEGEGKGPPPGGDGRNRMGDYIKRADADSDGKVSKEEFTNMARKESEERFSRMDSNSDGSVDQSELAAAAERARDFAKGRKGGGDEGGSRRPPGNRPEGSPPPPPGAPNADEIFGRMDGNSDGSVDKDEFATFSKQETEQRFARTDEDGDGKLSKDEVKSALQRMRGMLRGQGSPGGKGAGGGFRRPPNRDGEGGRPGGKERAPEGDAPAKKDAA